MRHPALRRSARYSGKRGPRDMNANLNADPQAGSAPANPAFQGGEAGGATGVAHDETTPPTPHDPAAQNRPAPGVPPDGEHNQGGARAEGIDYQRDLGSEQDA